jgi:tryptophan synthase alpha chain
VVGSAIVGLIGEHGAKAPPLVRDFISTLSAAVRRAAKEQAA